jgi:hypothetical protein
LFVSDFGFIVNWDCYGTGFGFFFNGGFIDKFGKGLRHQERREELSPSAVRRL